MYCNDCTLDMLYLMFHFDVEFFMFLVDFYQYIIIISITSLIIEVALTGIILCWTHDTQSIPLYMNMHNMLFPIVSVSLCFWTCTSWTFVVLCFNNVEPFPAKIRFYWKSPPQCWDDGFMFCLSLTAVSYYWNVLLPKLKHLSSVFDMCLMKH